MLRAGVTLEAGVLATLCPRQGRLGVRARVWLRGVLLERLVLEPLEEGLVVASHVVWGLGDLGPGGQQDGETEPQRGAGTPLISLVNQWQDWEVRLGDSRGLGLNTRLVADEACV